MEKPCFIGKQNLRNVKIKNITQEAKKVNK